MSESTYLRPDAEKAAVKALGDDIGFGRIIQLAHQCWDEMLEEKHGIKNHSEGWTLASADIIRERRAALTFTASLSAASPSSGDE